jgi:hypothetical protein
VNPQLHLGAASQMSSRSRKIALSATGWCVAHARAVTATWNKPLSLPPLLHGIKGDTLLRKDEPGKFERRLRGRFPTGSSEAALVRELLAERFKPDTAVGAAAKTAIFQRMGNLSDLARRDASVSWTVDEEGKLASMAGHYWVQVS